ncbi:hypothetical protein KBX50_20025 [Micromonospora sp. C51]|uniref:hypothetical protein n=1 Tax=Micromonospora sp. C51 TaxID=2824879 RepID=UPI001B362380|nr:hypothetical protein [Micromonospora sp. C51]MBQ1050750.1 hypothetical protein [Micromonospora sp. C51]
MNVARCPVGLQVVGCGSLHVGDECFKLCFAVVAVLEQRAEEDDLHLKCRLGVEVFDQSDLAERCPYEPSISNVGSVCASGNCDRVSATERATSVGESDRADQVAELGSYAH